MVSKHNILALNPNRGLLGRSDKKTARKYSMNDLPVGAHKGQRYGGATQRDPSMSFQRRYKRGVVVQRLYTGKYSVEALVQG